MVPPYVVLVTGSSKGELLWYGSVWRSSPLELPNCGQQRRTCTRLGRCFVIVAPIVARPRTSMLASPLARRATASATGVGRALAEEFLRAGDSVVVCARTGGPRASCLSGVAHSCPAVRPVGCSARHTPLPTGALAFGQPSGVRSAGPAAGRSRPWTAADQPG
jgi:hypothetical protein